MPRVRSIDAALGVVGHPALTGCAAFKIRLDTLHGTIAADSVMVSGCSGMIRRVLDSTASYKKSTRTVTLVPAAKNTDGAPVPALPPTSQPAWVLSDSNYAPPATGLPLGFARNVIHIIFKVGTSQAQRQQAVDQVGGVVVGGIPLTGGDGYYDVAIPDSGQGVQLQAAVTSLLSLIQVDGASVIVRSTTPAG
jgi:hypothetical protein